VAKKACTYSGSRALLPTITAYRTIAMNLDRSLTSVAQQPVNARQTTDYLERITTISSVDEFLDDPGIYTYALKAHGLEDMGYAKAFIRKVLVEGADKPEAFANKLADPRYKELAETFNFARYGETATVFDRAQIGTVQKFNRQTLEAEAGLDNEAVRLALYFRRQAPKAENFFDIIADPALAKVVQVLSGLPASIGAIDIDKQAALFNQRIDLANLKDPAKLEAQIERFAALWDAESQNTVAGAEGIASLLVGVEPSGFGPDDSTLLALQSWRGQR
jgi:hypothetical protein